MELKIKTKIITVLNKKIQYNYYKFIYQSIDNSDSSVTFTSETFSLHYIISS